MLKRNTSKQDTGISLRDALRVYLRTTNLCKATDMDTTVMPAVSIVDKYGSISCLTADIEAHDGRIRPVFE